MSIIVAVTKHNRTVMAADSLTCFGDTQQVPASNSTTSKLRTVGGSLLGGAGWGIYDNIFDQFLIETPPPPFVSTPEVFAYFVELWHVLHEKYPFVNDQAQTKDSPFGDLDSTFLIANHSGIYKVSHDMDVCSFKQYFAIGSGAEYALGALYNLYDQNLNADAIARGAVETAIQFDVHCGGEVHLQSAASEGAVWSPRTMPPPPAAYPQPHSEPHPEPRHG